MTPLLALGIILNLQAGYNASFADTWERWKRVDAAWNLGESKERRSAAIPFLKSATGQIFGAHWSEACQALDEGLARLEGRTVIPEQAVGIRFRPPVAEPGKAARLLVSWVYRPAETRSFPLKIGNRQVMLQPGRSLTLDVVPQQLEPELSRTPEMGVPVSAQVGSITRTVLLSILKTPRARIQKLMTSQKPEVRALAQKAFTMMEADLPAVPAVSIVTLVDLAEDLEAGRKALTNVDAVPYARQGPTSLQLLIPEAAQKSPGVTVVVGVSGFGGESAFFDSLNQGSAPAEAAQRGWIFVGASPTDSSVEDALLWVRQSLKKEIARYFVIGYSRSADVALSAGALKQKPSGMAAIAPANATFPRAWTEYPLYFGVGKQDVGRIVTSVQMIVRELGERKDVRHEEFEGVEHLMAPSEGIAGAFRFFDGLSGVEKVKS